MAFKEMPKNFLAPFLANLVVSIFAVIGFFLCVVPGLFVGLIYMPVYLVILDGEKDFWQAMETSRKMVMNNIVQWIILALVLFVLNLIGSIPCGLGVLVTGPMSLVVILLAYDMERAAVIDVTATPVPPEAPYA